MSESSRWWPPMVKHSRKTLQWASGHQDSNRSRRNWSWSNAGGWSRGTSEMTPEASCMCARSARLREQAPKHGSHETTPWDVLIGIVVRAFKQIWHRLWPEAFGPHSVPGPKGVLDRTCMCWNYWESASMDLGSFWDHWESPGFHGGMR